MNGQQQKMINEYISRINSVIDYIDHHLSQEMTLDELAEVAGFSKFHFHRIFYSFMKETLFQFIQRVRLQKGADRLCMNPEASITEIAYNCGFSSSAAFSRSFKAFFNQTPSQYRAEKSIGCIQNSNINQVDGNQWKEKIPKIPYNESILNEKGKMMMSDYSTQVKVQDFEEMTVAYVRYIGPYAGNEELFKNLFGKLYGWAGPRGFANDPNAKCLIIYHDNPEITDEEKLRMSVCLTVPEDTKVDGEIGKMTIPAGKYAMARYELTSEEYGKAWEWVYSQWLPQSGYEPDDRPCFEMYPEEEKDGKMIVDICIPVKPL
ncbi:MAG TPA: GyrI-like domain-containing protein [Thermotogota bacterium]|nr:GyrI-like domain-containing protein [Thermotogota bacterium]HRW35761.1 GyrI-like domain-containing protein [Thermotogota bacterium]